MIKYILIKNIQVKNVNAILSNFLAGPPSPMACRGFLHALSIKCGFKVSGFSIIHHSFSISGDSRRGYNLVPPLNNDESDYFTSYKKYIPYQNQAASFINKNDGISGSITLSLQPVVMGTYLFSLVIEVDDDEEIILEDIIDFFNLGRYAGGYIENFKIIKINNSFLLSSDEVNRLNRTGFYVSDESQAVLESYNASNDTDRDYLDVMMDMISERKTYTYKVKEGIIKNTPIGNTKLNDKKDENSLSWLLLSIIGYNTLSEFEKMSGARNNLLVATGEPLIGLLSLKPARSNVMKLWRYQASKEKGLFFVKQDL